MPMTLSVTVSSCTARGGRLSQEDHFIQTGMEIKGRVYQLLAVLDGHGGEEVAREASKRIPGYFAECLAQKTANKRIVYRLFCLVRKLQEDFQSSNSGSTLSLVCIPAPFARAYIAVVGDSPVLVCTPRRQILAPIHNVGTNNTERDMALLRGASFRWGDPGVAYIGKPDIGWIQLSRTIGDCSFGRFLDRQPSFLEVSLSQKSHILVGSDGLWKPGEPRESWIARMAEYLRKGESAATIVADGLRCYGEDNTTAVVWHKSP